MLGLTGGSAFRHGVASGDPTSRRVVIWTRVSGATGTTTLLAGTPHLRDLDMDSHGYSIVDLDRDRLRFEWWTVDGLDRRVPGPALGGAIAVRHGEPRLVADERPPEPAWSAAVGFAGEPPIGVPTA